MGLSDMRLGAESAVQHQGWRTCPGAIPMESLTAFRSRRLHPRLRDGNELGHAAGWSPQSCAP